MWLSVPEDLCDETYNNLLSLDFRLWRCFENNRTQNWQIRVRVDNQEQENLLKLIYNDYIFGEPTYGQNFWEQ